MSDTFELVSDYQPSGDQPQAIQSLVEGLKEKKKYQEPDYQTAFDASDLSGVNYESDVDTSTTGTKSTTVRIYDRFGNSVEKKVNIVVQ